MPGILLDQSSMNGVMMGDDPSRHLSNGVSPALTNQNDRGRNLAHLSNGVPMSNGIGPNRDTANDAGHGPGGALPLTSSSRGLDKMTQLPPEIQHITQDFIPLAKLINRSVQQCFNELTELVNELADLEKEQTSQSNQVNGRILPNGAPVSHQSPKSIRKKERILNFAQNQRAWFIKLLVLSQWSRNAGEVSKVIDLFAWINSQKNHYDMASLSMGQLKRDLAQAQLPNPDLRTALEVLSTGTVAALPDLNYIPVKPLSVKTMLKLLQKINSVLCVRLTLYDKVPFGLRKYHIRNGRVTFVVEDEFELDLSIADEDHTSQFYFIDLRFLFLPASPISESPLRAQLETRLNNILKNDGLSGAYDFLHDLLLSTKINALFKQARTMARGRWVETLRVDLVHRTLVVQYWLNRPGGKSWVEIGVNSGRGKEDHHESRPPESPFLDVRWFQEKKEIKDLAIDFDTADLSMDRILRSVVSLHSSSILEAIYTKVLDGALYATGQYQLELQTSSTDPEECYLKLQITKSSFLTILIEPISGSLILKPSSFLNARVEDDLNRQKDRVEISPQRIAHTRCMTAQDFLLDHVVTAGWEPLPGVRQRQEDGRLFDSGVLRYAFIRQKYWDRNWMLAMTHSMDGDCWWLMELKRPGPGFKTPQKIEGESIHKVIDVDNSWEYLHDLELYTAGLICFHANTQILQSLGVRRQAMAPPKFEKPFRPPKILLRFRPGDLPGSLRQNLLRNSNGQSWISETVSLTCEGIDAEKRAIYVARGRPNSPARFHSQLASKGETRVVFSGTDGTFAMKFTAPVGVPIIMPLLHRLQHLERVLSSIETIRRARFQVTSLSLSQLSVVYDQAANLLFHISFDYKEPSASIDFDTAKTSSPRSALEFDGYNPHRRIQQHLTALLNRSDQPNALDTVLKQLSLTLPLLRTFDELQRQRGNGAPTSTLTISHRSEVIYHLDYRNPRCHFTVYPSQHRDRVKWIISNQTKEDDSKSWPEGMADSLRRKILCASTAGWTALGSGAAANTNNPEPLFKAVDELVRSYAVEPVQKSAENIEAVPGAAKSEAALTKAPTAGASGAAAGGSAAEAISLD